MKLRMRMLVVGVLSKVCADDVSSSAVSDKCCFAPRHVEMRIPTGRVAGRFAFCPSQVTSELDAVKEEPVGGDFAYHRG